MPSSLKEKKLNSSINIDDDEEDEGNDFLESIVGDLGDKGKESSIVGFVKKDRDEHYIVIMAFKSEENYLQVKNLLPKNE